MVTVTSVYRSDMNEPLPDITIGIPTRTAACCSAVSWSRFSPSRPRAVMRCLLDSGSTYGSLDVIGAHPVVKIAQEHFDWGRMRERLFEEARGAMVVNLSQDAVPARCDWLSGSSRHCRIPAVGVSCGSSIPDPEWPFAQFQWERNGYYYFT